MNMIKNNKMMNFKFNVRGTKDFKENKFRVRSRVSGTFLRISTTRKFYFSTAVGYRRVQIQE